MGRHMGSGYLWALGFGGATLFLLGVTPGILVGMKGATIIHRAAIANLPLAEAEQAIQTKLGEMQRRAKEAKEQALKPAAEQPAPATQTPNADTPNPAPAPAALAAPLCPNCNHPTSADDVYCGNCGHKLK